MKPAGWIGRRPACPGSVMNLRAGRCYSQVFAWEEDPHALERTGHRNCATQRKWAHHVAKSRRDAVQFPNRLTAKFTPRATITVLKTKAVTLWIEEIRRRRRSEIWTSAVWQATPMIRAKWMKSQ